MIVPLELTTSTSHTSSEPDPNSRITTAPFASTDLGVRPTDPSGIPTAPLETSTDPGVRPSTASVRSGVSETYSLSGKSTLKTSGYHTRYAASINYANTAPIPPHPSPSLPSLPTLPLHTTQPCGILSYPIQLQMKQDEKDRKRGEQMERRQVGGGR